MRSQVVLLLDVLWPFIGLSGVLLALVWLNLRDGDTPPLRRLPPAE